MQHRQDARSKAPDSEKITINLGHVDLGQVDLLVQDGFYSNRTDLIRTAIRNLLSQHGDIVRTSVARHKLELGLRTVTRAELEEAARSGAPVSIRALGLVIIADDVSPELARSALASIHVLGALQASPQVKAAIRDRIV